MGSTPRAAPCLFWLLALGVLPVADARAANRVTRVLFIGNSYTYFHNLPEMFAKLAAAGGERVEVRMVAPGGWRLKDHWEKGDARKALRDGEWDYVVLQDQSTLGVTCFVDGQPRVTSDEVFRPAAEQWAAEIAKMGATPVFYLTWARKATPEDQKILSGAYLRAAHATGARVAPVGIAWAEVRSLEPSLELYIDDGSHPSAAGSYLAACALYGTLFEKSPEGLPASVSGAPVDLDSERVQSGKTAVLVALSEAQAYVLQRAAWRACDTVEQEDPPAEPEAALEALNRSLPEGTPIEAGRLSGKWQGELKLYPPAPVAMALELRRANQAWRGTLVMNPGADKSARIELADLSVGEREITFTQPNAVNGTPVSYRAVLTEKGELRGLATATSRGQDAPQRYLGSWRLEHQP
jgi:hypothetical protein